MGKIAIIPARGGSKRIPRKNVKDFLGKPVLSYSIQVALESGLFDEIMVSTDDHEIAEIAIQFGASVPFLRSKKNSDDFSGMGDVVYEVLEMYREFGKTFETGCCIFATAPLISVKNITNAFELLNNSDFDTVFPVVNFSFPIWRSFKRSELNGKIEMNFPEFEKMRSQDIAEAFHDAGQFYWFKPSILKTLQNKNVFGLNRGSVVLDNLEVQDIDNPEDWILAEIKAGFINNK